MWFLPERSEIYVKKFSADDGSDKGALISFRGQIKDNLIAHFRENYRVEGKHIKTGGRISAESFGGLILSGSGSWALSSKLSGQLFMATANPDTLMRIGNGVGSAVMAGGQIVGQAPFVAAGGAIMPVAAPLLIFQALTTVMIMNQFELVHEKLSQLERSVSRALQRSEGTVVGEIISASNKVEEVERQFGICNGFTESMIIKLSLLEDKVNSLFERYSFLYSVEYIDRTSTSEQLKFKESDAYFAVMLSILDLRIDLLRLKLAIQESPGYMKHSTDNLIGKVERYKRLWAEIASFRRTADLMPIQLKAIIEEMNWWQREMPRWLGGDRSERSEVEGQISEFEKHAERPRAGRNSELAMTTEIASRIRDSEHMSLFYWLHQLGEHSYYTNDIELRVESTR